MDVSTYILNMSVQDRSRLFYFMKKLCAKDRKDLLKEGKSVCKACGEIKDLKYFHINNKYSCAKCLGIQYKKLYRHRYNLPVSEGLINVDFRRSKNKRKG